MNERDDLRHGAIVLAGGASRRLGRAKQLIEIDGEPLLRRVTRAVLTTQPLDCVVVLGHDAERMRSVLSGLSVRCAIAEDHASGMSASLRTGLAALDPRCAGALIVLTDQPALAAAHLLALCDAWRARPDHAVASAYADVRGVPALLPRAWFADVANLRGDVGARDLLRANASAVITITVPALAQDIDTAADIPERLR
jgi:CTP:molybdopterin cytidylyltransferase MocA